MNFKKNIDFFRTNATFDGFEKQNMMKKLPN